MIKVVEYNSAWPQVFRDEAIKIKDALGDNCITVHHIGSTSIPGIVAKPIIDMLPVVRNLKTVDTSNVNMERLGYEVKGEFGFMLRRFFVKENAFHVHVFEQNNPEIERHLNFRNWMRDHPKDRNAYASLKKMLAEKYSNDRQSYCFGKDEFVADIDEKAGWHGVRIVKALTENEWSVVKKFREQYFCANNHKHDSYIKLLDDPAHVHLVVLKKVAIIGYAHIQLYPDKTAVLRFIFINDDHRKQHFGSDLLIFIEKWLISLDFKILYSEICPDSSKFLNKYGFNDMIPAKPDCNKNDLLIGKLLIPIP